MAGTLVLLGYGSLLSKKGLLRDGRTPHVHRAWAARIPGQRGWNQTLPGGRAVVLDAFLEGAQVLVLRALPDYVDGAGTTRAEPSPRTNIEPTFEAIALEVDDTDWSWYVAREALPHGLGDAIAEDAQRTGRDIPDLLGALLSEAGLESYGRLLYERYRTRVSASDYESFARCALPVPIKLPEGDDAERATGHRWGIVCVSYVKDRPRRRAADAARLPDVDVDALVLHYVECLLGAAHGLDVADLVDPAFEAAQPQVHRLIDAHTPDEARPLPRDGHSHTERAAPAAADAGVTRGMRPLAGLIQLDEAWARLAAVPVPQLEVEDVALDAADGRVLAQEVRSGVDVPGADRCAMDGYAVRAADTVGADADAPIVLRCVGTRHAGATDGLSVSAGTCVQVATGAVLPNGADAVIMVERTRAARADVEVLASVSPGQHVIRRGSDIAAGAVVLRAGTTLNPSALAALAAVGSARVAVRRRPRVAVLPTGTEVVPVGAALRPEQVYDSNAHALVALARRAGAEAQRLDAVADEEDALAAALVEAAATHDVVVVTGGTSAGARDLLPRLLAARGTVLFHGVSIRPGKPVVAARVGDAIVLGLPGYPTSCVVTAELFLVPLLARLLGAGWRVRGMTARLGARLVSKHGYREFIPVRIDPDKSAHVVFRGSSAVTSLSDADGLLDVAEDVEVVPEGTEVQVRLLT